MHENQPENTNNKNKSTAGSFQQSSKRTSNIVIITQMNQLFQTGLYKVSGLS